MTMKILRFSAASLVSAAVDLSLFTIMVTFVVTSSAAGIMAATAAARMLSGICNFYMNRNWVFHSQSAYQVQTIAYTILFFMQMISSFLLVWLLSFLPIPIIAAKIAADGTLFLFSYQIQRRLIFRSSPKGDDL